LLLAPLEPSDAEYDADHTDLKLFLVFPRYCKHLRDIFREAQHRQRFIHMLCSDSLLRLLLCNIVCFRRYQRYEFDTAVYKEVAGIFAKREAGFIAEDLSDDLLDSRCRGNVSPVSFRNMERCSGRSKSR
jgi:hypothetical protein